MVYNMQNLTPWAECKPSLYPFYKSYIAEMKVLKVGLGFRSWCWIDKYLQELFRKG